MGCKDPGFLPLLCQDSFHFTVDAEQNLVALDEWKIWSDSYENQQTVRIRFIAIHHEAVSSFTLESWLPDGLGAVTAKFPKKIIHYYDQTYH